MDRFSGQVCLVTGGTQGIGLAIAERMAQEGGVVHVCSRKQQNVEEARTHFKAKGLNVTVHQCNVSDKQERQRMLKAILDKHDGVLDVLVPNAACSTYMGPQMKITEEAFDKMFDLNVKSVFFLIQESIEALRKSREQGRSANIMVVSSLMGRNPDKQIGVYSATKAALDTMVLFLAKELLPDGIRINGIAPGMV